MSKIHRFYARMILGKTSPYLSHSLLACNGMGKLVLPLIQSYCEPFQARKTALYAVAAAAVHKAAFRLLDLSKCGDDENWVVSPVGLTAVFGQLMLGSKGEFHKVLGEIISPDENANHLPGLDIHREIGDLLHFLQDGWSKYLLYINSALFVSPEMKLKQSFKHALRDIYNSDILVTNFTQEEKTMLEVNTWVLKSTLGYIEKLLTLPLPPDTSSFFANTVYFKGLWGTPFDPVLTRTRLFNVSPTKQVPVTFMVGDLEVLHYEDKTRTMIGIPYRNFEIFLYIFLPKKGENGKHFKVEEIIDNLSLESIKLMRYQADVENITISMPRLKVNSKLSLRKPIVQAINRNKLRDRSILNVLSHPTEEDDFTNLASNRYQPNALPLKIDSYRENEKYRVTFNMGSASDDLRFQVDDIVHNVQMEITEKGTEAVAISSSLVDYSAGKAIIIDKPFLFLILHEATGAILFLGMVNNPQQDG